MSSLLRCTVHPAVRVVTDALPLVNHYMTCDPLTAEEASSPPPSASEAESHALGHGWRLGHTAMTGDCGIDALAYAMGHDRVQDVWAVMRAELADFMLEAASCPVWQGIFHCCQEAEAAPAHEEADEYDENEEDTPVWPSSLSVIPAGAASSSSSSAAVAGAGTASSCLDPPLPPPSSPLRSPTALDTDVDAAGVGDAASSLVELSLDGGGGGVPSGTVVAGLVGDVCPAASGPIVEQHEGHCGDAGSKPITVVGDGRFTEWIRSMTPEELMETSTSYATWIEVEARWRKVRRDEALEQGGGQTEVVARRSHGNSKVNYRLTVGLAYLRWKDSEQPSTKSHLKEHVWHLIVFYRCLLFSTGFCVRLCLDDSFS